MPTLDIGGQQVEVGEGFLRLSPAQQQSTVDEIARSLGGSTPSVPSPSASAGSILPFSRDQQGNTQFDLTAGIPGMIGRVATLPGDVVTGRMPVFTPEGQFNPEFMRRSAEFASAVSPANPAMRAGDMAIPGQALRAPTRYPAGPMPAAPTAEQLKAAGGAGYDTARGAGVDITGDAVANMANQLQQTLQGQHGIIAEVAPKTYATLNKLTSPPEGGFATISGLEAARRGFQNIALEGGSEGFAARQAARSIDDLFGSLGPQNTMAAGGVDPAAVAQTLRDARGNYGAALRSNELTGTLDRATTGIVERAEGGTSSTYSGLNLDNAIRQRVRSFLEKPENVAGLSDAEIKALEKARDGGSVRNVARYVGNLLGGGGGLGQAVTAGGVGAFAGGAETGAALGLGTAATGLLSKMLSNSLAKRSVGAADEMVRSRSPLYEQMLQQRPTAGAVPGFTHRDETILRALLPGLLAPPQPVVPGLLQDPRQLGPLA